MVGKATGDRKGFTVYCGGVRVRAVTGSAAPTHGQAPGTTRHHHIVTATKDFAQYRIYNRCTSRTAFARAGIDFQSASKCFCDVALVPWAWPEVGAAQPVLAHILTPQHIVKFFCHPHRRSSYAVMLRYFSRILFSSLCWAVIGFVADIIHGVLFDTFCF